MPGERNPNIPAIGIDFGTRFARAAVLRNSQVELIPTKEGAKKVPCYITFNGKEQLIGEHARSRLQVNHNNTIFDVKRLIGRTYNEIVLAEDCRRWSFEVGRDEDRPVIQVGHHDLQRTLFPEQLVALILSQLKENAENYLGFEICHAVIAVPASFNDGQREAMIDAAKLAGLNLLRLVSDPTSAAVTYSMSQDDTSKKHILLFDWGAGTLDVSIISVQGRAVEVKATAGDSHFGGLDLDNRMVDYCILDFQNRFEVDLRNNGEAFFRLLAACNRVKHVLSFCNEAPLLLENLHENITYSTTITKELFEKLHDDLINAAMEPVERVLQDAGMCKAQVDEIVVIGGCSRIPKIQKLLREYFDDKPLTKVLNPETTVVHGAALQAATLVDGLSADIPEISWRETMPFTLGLATPVGVITPLIRRNSQYPIKRAQLFTTSTDDQPALLFEVYEGEQVLAGTNHFLGSFEVSGISPAPRGEPRIEVTFDVDENGVLGVYAVDLDNHVANPMSVTTWKGRLCKTEFDQLCQAADWNKTQNFEMLKKSKATESLNYYLCTLRRLMEDELLKERLTKAEYDLISLKYDETVQWMREDLTKISSKYDDRLKDLVDSTNPILVRISQQSTAFGINAKMRESKAVVTTIVELLKE